MTRDPCDNTDISPNGSFFPVALYSPVLSPFIPFLFSVAVDQDQRKPHPTCADSVDRHETVKAYRMKPRELCKKHVSQHASLMINRPTLDKSQSHPLNHFSS